MVAKEVVEISSEPENEDCDGTFADIVDGCCDSPIQDRLSSDPARKPRRLVTVFDSDEEGLDRVLPASYPVDETSLSFAQDYGSHSMSPPTPAQRQRRYVSPSPHSSSSDYLPMPGAFPPTPFPSQEPPSPHNENMGDDFDGRM